MDTRENMERDLAIIGDILTFGEAILKSCASSKDASDFAFRIATICLASVAYVMRHPEGGRAIAQRLEPILTYRTDSTNAIEAIGELLMTAFHIENIGPEYAEWLKQQGS